jgi:hypothetical protein
LLFFHQIDCGSTFIEDGGVTEVVEKVLKSPGLRTKVLLTVLGWDAS